MPKTRDSYGIVEVADVRLLREMLDRYFLYVPNGEGWKRWREMVDLAYHIEKAAGDNKLPGPIDDQSTFN